MYLLVALLKLFFYRNLLVELLLWLTIVSNSPVFWFDLLFLDKLLWKLKLQFFCLLRWNHAVWFDYLARECFLASCWKFSDVYLLDLRYWASCLVSAPRSLTWVKHHVVGGWLSLGHRLLVAASGPHWVGSIRTQLVILFHLRREDQARWLRCCPAITPAHV